MPALVDDARRCLAAARAGSPEDRFEAAAWRALLAQVGPALLRRDCAPSHLTASAVVLTADATRTCLVLHRKLGLWVQPGGHLEAADHSIAGAAAREVSEESGLTGRILPAPILLSRHRAPCAPGIVDWHLDIRMVLVSDPTEPTASDETPEVGWWAVDALPEPLADGIADLVQAGVNAVSASH